MFYKILLITAVLTISCAATEQKANHATYSQSFVREDVPLSYKYSAVHHYVPKHIAPEEPKHTKKYNKPNLKAQKFVQKNIQFAPLPNQKEPTYETTAPSPIPKDNRYEQPSKSHYSSYFHNPMPEYQQHEYKMSENSAPSIIHTENLQSKPSPISANNPKPFTYKPHVNHNIKSHQSPHVSSLNNYYGNIKYEYPMSQEQVNTEPAQNLDSGDILKYLHVYQQGLYPGYQAATATTTENPINSYAALENNKYFLPKEEVPLTPQEPSMYWSMAMDPRLAYYTSHKTSPVRTLTYGGETKQGKLPKYSRFNYVRFQPKNHALYHGTK